MWVQVHRFVPAESSAPLSRPCCGAYSRKTHSARAGCYSTRPRGGRDRLRSSLRQLNRWRVQWQLNRRQGRPRQTPSPGSAVSGAAVVRVRPRLSFVGVHLFAHWLDHQRAFDLVVAQLTQAIETHKHTHPDDDFALLHHREQTLRHRFQALFFAPLFGIEHLTEFDTREHPLATLLGHSYQSSTLDNSRASGPMRPSCPRWYRPKPPRSRISMAIGSPIGVGW